MYEHVANYINFQGNSSGSFCFMNENDDMLGSLSTYQPFTLSAVLAKLGR